MIIAIILVFSFGIADLFPTLPPIGLFGNILFGILTAVAIMKYDLLDIGVATRKGLAYLLMSAIVAVPYVLVIFFFHQLLNRAVPVGILIVIIILLALAFSPIWQRVQAVVDRWFYRRRYDFLKELERFSKETHDIRNLKQLGASLVDLVNRALQTSNIKLLLASESGNLTTISSSGENPAALTLRSGNPVIKWLQSNKGLLYYEDLNVIPELQYLSTKERKELEGTGVELFIPLKTKKDELVGVLTLGRKLSMRPYSEDEERLVLTVANHIAMNLENARLYHVAKRSEKALRESEKRFRTIVEAAPSFLMILDATGGLVYASPNCERYTGYTEEELRSNPALWLHDDEVARLREVFQEVVRSGQAGKSVEYKAVRRNGDVWYASSSWQPLRDDKGKTKAVVAQTIDISEHSRMDAERKDMQRKAQMASRLASVGEMASGIAHEINNPLTAIIGYSQLLMQRDVPENIKRGLGTIHDASEQVASIVSRLLTFARKQKPEKKLVDINHVIEDTLALRAYAMETSNIEVIRQLEPDLPHTMADLRQLEEVFLNIIVNAETEMKLARGGGKLIIKTEKIDEHLCIHFIDDGPGIAEKNLEKIFDPFFTTREVGKGTGLGLSLSHGIVAEHNGRIYAKSELGDGATFVIEFPIVAGEEQTDLGKSDDGDTTDKQIDASILVVDDEPKVSELLSDILTEEGHKVEAVSNAADALNKMRYKDYRLILLDIKLPGMSGIELYDELLRTAPVSAKKVVFITGDVMGKDTKEFFAKTKCHCICKPFDIQRLSRELNDMLAHSK